MFFLFFLSDCYFLMETVVNGTIYFTNERRKSILVVLVKPESMVVLQ